MRKNELLDYWTFLMTVSYRGRWGDTEFIVTIASIVH